MVHGDEKDEVIVAIGDIAEDENARGLRHGFNDEDAGHDGKIREVSGEERFVGGDVFDAQDTFGIHFEDSIDKQHGVTMRQDAPYLINIQIWHGAPGIITTVHQTLSWAEQAMPRFKRQLKAMVEVESPSDDKAAVDRFGSLLADTVSGEAEVKLVSGGSAWGRHVLCRFGKKRRNGRQVLVLAHGDTVWPMGTLLGMPFREVEGRLWGPGVLDMKGGICVFLFAVRAARELGLPLPDSVLLQVNSDEEVGSPSSRQLTEENARKSEAVLVVEPGTGLEGKLKTERKGVGNFLVTVKGRASHAGVDFERGASAVVELARQIERISGWTDMARGVTVNAGVIGGGTKSNVVAAEAWAEVDFRVRKLADAVRLERKFGALRAVDRRCSVAVSGGLNRPPMERSAGGRRLFGMAVAAGQEVGLAVEESATGGGSDGNFTAALGVPTLDGLGCAGEGAHALNESILLDLVPGRIALLAGLLGRLS